MGSVDRAQVLESSRNVICFLKVLASDFHSNFEEKWNLSVVNALCLGEAACVISLLDLMH